MGALLAILIIICAFSFERPVISSIIRHANNSSIFPSQGLERKERKMKKKQGRGRNNYAILFAEALGSQFETGKGSFG